MTLKKYIRNKKQNKYRINGIDIEEKDGASSGVNVPEVIKSVIKRIPSHLLINIKNIKIGNFEELNRRKIQAMYKSSTVFVTNIQDNSRDLLDDVIHEVAHSVEEVYQEDIYSDGTLEEEFLRKRREMWQTLKSRGLEYNLHSFLTPEYNKQFDDLLHQEIGYEILRTLLHGIYYSPYAATSLREYFANGFEAFFMKEEVSRLKRISPVLYEKIIILMDKKDEV